MQLICMVESTELFENPIGGSSRHRSVLNKFTLFDFDSTVLKNFVQAYPTANAPDFAMGTAK